MGVKNSDLGVKKCRRLCPGVIIGGLGTTGSLCVDPSGLDQIIFKVPLSFNNLLSSNELQLMMPAKQMHLQILPVQRKCRYFAKLNIKCFS